MNLQTIVPLALVLFLGACSGELPRAPNVGATPDVTATGTAPLTAGTIQWLDGTYGAGCADRSGNWSLRVSGSATMDYPSLSVILNNTGCVLTLTKIAADQTYTTTSPIAMTTSYAGSASLFTGSGGLSFYANAMLSSASFASTFTITVLYSDNPNLLTSSLATAYAAVSSSSSTAGSNAPNYTLDLTTGALAVSVSATTSSVQSASGTANLVQGTVTGGGYYVDQGTLASNPTFAQLDTAYSGATTTAISGNPVAIPASAFGLTGVNISSSVVRTIVIQRNNSGVRSYQTFAITFGCGSACGVCPTGQTSKADSSGYGAANVCCASAATTLNCNGTCTNTLVDANNCGSCGTVCGAATPACSNGSCVVSCPTGESLCGGLCVDLRNDVNNCGSCGTTCAASLGQTCSGGVCGYYCTSPNNDLSYIGTGDFTISFAMTATGSGSEKALINQRWNCTNNGFWATRISATGYLVCETNDGVNDLQVTATTYPVNDGASHTVVVQRAAQMLTAFVDGQAVAAGTSTANWNFQLTTLQSGTDPCDGTNAALTVTNTCITPSAIVPPVPNGTYEILGNGTNYGSALAMNANGGVAGTGVIQSVYAQTNQNHHWTISRLTASSYKILSPIGTALTAPSANGQLTLQNYTGATNQLWSFVLNGTKYNLMNLSSGQAIDDWGGWGDGQVHQYGWQYGLADQKWTLNPPFVDGTYQFIGLGGLVLDDPNGGGAGTTPGLLAYAGANQGWAITRVSGIYYKVLAASGAALTSGTTAGTIAALATYTGATNQLWYFQQNTVNGSTYFITNAGTGLVLDVSSGAIRQWPYGATRGQDTWQVVQSVTAPITNGNYALTNPAGTALDDPSGGGAGTTPGQVAYSGANQNWAITLVSGLQYKIIAASGAALTATGNSSNWGAMGGLASYTGSNNQLWTFVPAGSNYNVISVGTTLALDDNGTGSGTPNQWGYDPTIANQQWTLTSVGTTSIANYLFNETSGTTSVDSSGNYAAATLTGATFASGLDGNAATMNGTSSQYVTLPAGIVSTLTDFSISTWVYVSAAASPWPRVFDFGTGTTAYMFLTVNSSPGVRFAITSSGSGNEQRISYGTSLSTGSWHHLVVTHSGSTGTLYIDNAQAGQNTSMTLSPSSLGSTTQNWLGRSQWAGDPYLNGQIDNFRIYNRALSSAEVQLLYTAR